MRPLSFAVVSILSAIGQGRGYGFDIMDDTGLASGTVYPALVRLERRGLVRSKWEDERAAHREGRPARRYYELTGEGQRALAAEIERYRSLSAAPVRPALRHS
jgi:DNA-binding PadR family transcriptional regulator